MRTLGTALILCLSACLPAKLSAQPGDVAAVNDTLCIQLGEDANFNVTDNDLLPQGAFLPVFLTTPSNCFNILEDGRLVLLSEEERCCGEHVLEYQYEGCQGGPECFGLVFITVKCPKPECFLVNLEDYAGEGSDPTGGGNPMDPGCVYACENSEATYYVSYNPTSAYNWSVAGGTFTAGANPAEIHVSWGAMGSGTVAVAIANSNNETTLTEVCVDILEGPIAAFQPSAACVCLNAPISFANTSTGGNGFFWEFGDGNTSTLFEPTHQYAGPGTYTVTLYTTRNNYDEKGNPLCCCTDSTSLEVEVDSLEGPGIYWISTLCANDSTKYWTDAMNCGTYNWTVLDENGLPLPFAGQGNDTICVQWGAGPFGTVVLEVADCDGAYCDKPVSVKVPIIPSTVGINGLAEVCENAIATYTVPKWASVYYDWQVTGGAVLSGQGTNTVVVQWGAAPGPGVINLNYSSSFLGGLPGQEPSDCSGTANLSVAIKPAFGVTGPSPAVACTNSVSSFFATAAPSASYTWAVTPPATFSGQGTSAINVTWDSGPGNFTVTAIPNDTTAYCNDSVSVRVRVEELPPPDGIDGPTVICPGQAYAYFAQSSESGVGFSWTVTNGTLSSAAGNPVTVTWNAGGPYALALQQYQLNAPFCTSGPVAITVLPKLLNGPLAVTGPPACTNSTQSYSAGPAQHPDATFNWVVTPASLGSVISGQGTPNVQVQWNNDPGIAMLSLSVELCGNLLSTTKSIPLIAPQVPAITQIGDLCPGVPATLDAGGGFSSYQWSAGPTTQTISIATGGTYTVTTTDAGGCQAVASFTANAIPGPVADISTPNNTTLCIAPPNSASVTLYAQTNPGYTFQWFCNGTPQALPPSQATLTHNNTNVNGTFAYHVVVTGANGCTKTSNTITVIQTDNCPTGTGGCTQQSYYLSTSAVNQTPNCNVVNFYTFKTANVTVMSWNFGDPGNNINTGTLLFPIHAYTKAGYFTATVTAQVPEAAPGTGFCTVTRTRSVNVPIAADFLFADSCQKVSFTDLSTFLPGNAITSWSWSFGDAGTSTAQNPSHTYLSPGTYNVTLTVANAAGCQATIVKPVAVAGLPNPAITIAPSPACVGTPANFSGAGAGITQWFWDFDDGSTNGGQNPSHTYLNPGIYDVTLTVQDAKGCENTTMQAITVYPAPPDDTIAYTPSLAICEGETADLIAPSGAGYTYLWSTSASAQLITVSTAGTYSVIVTDANGCTLAPDPVTVVVYPAPDAFISGSSVICDQGCTTLSAPAGFGYAYQWLDDANLPIPFQTGQTLVVCDAGLLPAYSVVVTDANGCSATSAPFSVTLEVSPSFTVTVMPDSCEGSPSILTVNPVQPGVIYSWSNGGAGPSITVLQAGTYTAIGTDTLSGCRGSASATIYPLPDLCLVPMGCYETCNPDTICGPEGLAAYQWNRNGAPIAGATDQCLIVTQSGAYSLTGTTEFGCTLTFDTLILEVLECDCASLAVSALPVDSCCWSISYDNTYSAGLLGLMIQSPDADLDFDLSGLDPSLGVQTIGTNWIGLINSLPNTPLPGGQLADFITFCLSNVQASPQQVIFDWYDLELNVACSDTLEFNCPVEPDCLYLAADSIYCENGQATYELTVCNPNDAAFEVGFIQIQPAGPAGVAFSPPAINVAGSPIQPGECRTFTLLLSGPGIAGQDFCFNLIAHEFDPLEVPTALCCSLDTLYCIPIPDCEPCDDIGVESATLVPDAISGGCCFDITLFNNYQAGFFDGIALCMLSPNTGMTINNPFGSGWATNYYSPTLIELAAAPSPGNGLPSGAFQLPEICVQTQQAPNQLLEIKWMQRGKVICRDTIALFCEPDCGYLFQEDIRCNAGGSWTYNATLKNTSAFTMGEAHIMVSSPAGMGSYDQTIALGALPPGGTFPIGLPLGAPALPGDSACVTVALHEIGHDSLHTNCCNFPHCFVLPDCAGQEDCLCDQSLSALVAQGFSCALDPATSSGAFAPVGAMTHCDTLSWSWGDGTAPGHTAGNASIAHTFPAAGLYQVCMNVVRTDIDGNLCEQQFCKDVDLGPIPPARLAPPIIYKNPSDGAFVVELDQRLNQTAHFRLFDINKQLVEQWEASEHLVPVDVRGVPKGLYLLVIEAEGERWVEKVVVQ
ncbi:MAG: PKD domain-containing protein [Lewinellaceae bacterium]|nr:PKD domain-containing protein [Phaeodactylibacter sp.]MCB9036801.1 PKD domain-containing protein [Lewinellaceae bacterium]